MLGLLNKISGGLVGLITNPIFKLVQLSTYVLALAMATLLATILVTIVAFNVFFRLLSRKISLIELMQVVLGGVVLTGLALFMVTLMALEQLPNLIVSTIKRMKEGFGKGIFAMIMELPANLMMHLWLPIIVSQFFIRGGDIPIRRSEFFRRGNYVHQAVSVVQASIERPQLKLNELMEREAQRLRSSEVLPLHPLLSKDDVIKIKESRDELLKKSLEKYENLLVTLAEDCPLSLDSPPVDPVLLVKQKQVDNNSPWLAISMEGGSRVYSKKDFEAHLRTDIHLEGPQCPITRDPLINPRGVNTRYVAHEYTKFEGSGCKTDIRGGPYIEGKPYYTYIKGKTYINSQLLQQQLDSIYTKLKELSPPLVENIQYERMFPKNPKQLNKCAANQEPIKKISLDLS